MNFSTALLNIKNGRRLTRSGWNGREQFIFLVQGSTFEVNRAPLNEFYPEGTMITYNPHIDIRSVDGRITPWLASQTDLLAEDWVVVAGLPEGFQNDELREG